MPYELAFTKKVQIDDDSLYFNECCYGGDVISDVLMPKIREIYTDIQSGQEDWGWFIWFKGINSRLAVDIYCDDFQSGDYRIHLTSRKKGWILDKIIDTPELDDLKQSIIQVLETWASGPIKVDKLDAKYMPATD